MINIPVTHIQSKIDASTHLTVGRSLIDQMTDNGAICNGVVPIIFGGAVRDVIFKDVVPHDVDIFLARGNGFGRQTDTPAQIKEDIALWLEDRGIEWRSLISERAAHYASSDLTLYEIFDFVFEGINIQIILTDAIHNIDTLSDNFPSMCRFALSTEYLHFTPISFATTLSDRPVVATARDARYAFVKYPNEPVYQFYGTTEMYATMIRRYTADRELETTVLTQGDVRDYRNVTPQHSNSIGTMMRTLVQEKLSLPDDVDLGNRNVTLLATWNAGRLARIVTSSTATATSAPSSRQWREVW